MTSLQLAIDYDDIPDPGWIYVATSGVGTPVFKPGRSKNRRSLAGRLNAHKRHGFTWSMAVPVAFHHLMETQLLEALAPYVVAGQEWVAAHPAACRIMYDRMEAHVAACPDPWQYHAQLAELHKRLHSMAEAYASRPYSPGTEH